MEVKKEKSGLKASDVELDIFNGNNIVDLRNLDTNVIIDHLEASIEARSNPIEKKLKQKFGFRQ